MIPIGGQLPEIDIEETTRPSRTWFLDLDKGRITGMVDELDAVRQVVFKILQTERFVHLIYSFDYASELTSLTGKSESFLRSELDRRINEALLQDDRITGITDFQVTVQGDSALISFTVISIYGSYREEINRRV